MGYFFGDEPTCCRCDYPRRLHHLLGVDHDYTERPHENAPDAGQGIEGNEKPSNQDEGANSSMIQTTRPAQHSDDELVAEAAKLGIILVKASEGESTLADVDAAEVDEPIESALDLLCKRAEASQAPRTIDADILAKTNPRPEWAEELIIDKWAATAEWCGPAIDIPISMHPGERLDTGKVDPAFTRLRLLRRLCDKEPRIRLERWQESKDDEQLHPVLGSHYWLTLDEARQLAHDLLLLLDVAHGATDGGAA